MIVPVPWFFFLNYLDTNVSRAGSYEAALIAFWEMHKHPKAREEILLFLERAAQNDDENDLAHVECPDAHNEIFEIPVPGVRLRDRYQASLDILRNQVSAPN